MFPPFPGDSVVVAASAASAAAGGHPIGLLAAATAGSALGAALDWRLGRFGAGRVDGLAPWQRRWVDRLVGALQRHGAVLLVINRFVPGVRALFFVAAGLAGLPLRAVVGWSVVSSLLWNAALVAVGTWVGWNVDRMGPALVIVAAAAIAVGVAAIALRRATP